MLKSTRCHCIIAVLLFAISGFASAQQPPAPQADEYRDVEPTPETIPTILRRVRTEGASDAVFYAPAGVERMRIDSDTGFVGIGSNGIAPPYDLYVKGDANRAVVTQVENLHTGADASSVVRVYSDVASANVMAHGSGRTLSRFGAPLDGWSEVLHWRGNGLILGTLHNVPLILGTNSVNRVHITPDGRIGIGTATPTALLHLYGAPEADTFMGVGTDTTDGPAVTAGMAGASFGRGAAFINVRPDTSAAAPNPSLRFGTGNVQRMIITSTGRVGIGTTNPAEALHVVGNFHATGDIRADGVIHAKYQDLAEWVPATEDLAPGTVVVLNPQRDNQVMASRRSYDTTVAGVVSAQPGVVLGDASPDKETIATTGRVRVRVDARHEPIAIGDLLVTSDTAGTAMKSRPFDVAGVSIHRPGTIIGKALQALAEGEGEILVLLSLQ